MHDVRAANADFADLAARDFIAVFVADFHFAPWCGLAGRAEFVCHRPFEHVALRSVNAGDRRTFGLAVGMEKLNVRHQLHRAHNHRLRHWRGAIGQPLEAGEVEILHARMVDRHIHHGRHQQRLRNAPALNRLQSDLRIEGRNEIVLDPQLRAAKHGDAIRDVEHRRGMQEARAPLVLQQHQAVEGVEHQSAMGKHHALGAAGRTAGVKQTGQILITALGVRHRIGGGHDILKAMHSFRHRVIAQIDDLLHMRDLPLQRRENRSKLGVDEQDFGFRIIEPVLDLRRRQADVDRDEHAARPDGAIKKLEIAVTVQRQDGSPVALAQAQLAQRARQFRHPVPRLAPGAAAFPAVRPQNTGRGLIAFDLCRALQALGEIHGRAPVLTGCFWVLFAGNQLKLPAAQFNRL